jgi:predicted DNA-binding ribbon-helix-helix protein
VTLEGPFFQAIKEIAADQQLEPSTLIDQIYSTRGRFNLSSAIRVFVVEHYMALPRAGIKGSIATVNENSAGL